jgi:MFS family permease
MIFAVIAGFGMMGQTTMINTIIQTTAAPEMRGRVISYFAMSYFGMMPLGSLLIGGIAQMAGAQATMLGSGIMALIILAIAWKFLSKGIDEKKEEVTQLLTTNTTKTWKQTARL